MEKGVMTYKSQTATVLYSTNVNLLCRNLTKEYNVFHFLLLYAWSYTGMAEK